MSLFWSLWVMFLVVLNLGITLFLFLWAPRASIPVQADGTSGHVWAYGVLREGVRKLPLWWVVMSAAMFVAGFAYLALFPGFGAFKGLLGWTSHRQLAQAVAATDPAVRKARTESANQLVQSARTAFGTNMNFQLGAGNLMF